MDNYYKKIIKKLIKKKITISVAESCTGGLLSKTLTSVANSSKIFKFGAIVYSNKSKINILKISKKVIKKHGAVSPEVCHQMIKKLGNISKSNILISITGIAGPGGGSIKKPVGLVYIGFKITGKILIIKCLFKNKGRNYIRNSAIKKSFELINKNLK